MSSSPPVAPNLTPIPFIEHWFPNCTVPGTLSVTSPEDTLYNCVAWSLGITDRWLQPMTDMGPVSPWAIWPDLAARGTAIETFVKMYRGEGFIKATGKKLEAGFDKIVLYWNDATGEFLHVARQHQDGTWWSKLGMASDVSHVGPDTLGPPGSPGGYGKVWGYMKRAKGLAAQDTPVRQCISRTP